MQEERRRILVFFEHRAQEWTKLVERSQDVTLTGDGTIWMLPGVRYDSVAVGGREAFARQQAHQFRLMASHFRTVWKNIDYYCATNGQDPTVSIYSGSSIELDEIEDNINDLY